MSPFRYQLTSEEFRKEWSVKNGEPMSTATLWRRKSWAQEHYPQWRKVFLYGGRIDVNHH